jgi:hypothetical protein
MDWKDYTNIVKQVFGPMMAELNLQLDEQSIHNGMMLCSVTYENEAKDRAVVIAREPFSGFFYTWIISESRRNGYTGRRVEFIKEYLMENIFSQVEGQITDADRSSGEQYARSIEQPSELHIALTQQAKHARICFRRLSWYQGNGDM